MAELERRENLAWVKTKLTGASPKSSARILTEDEGSRIINLLEEKKTSERRASILFISVYSLMRRSRRNHIEIRRECIV